MKQRIKATAVVASIAGLALAVTACTASGGGGNSNTSAASAIQSTATSHPATTITVWTFNTLTNEIKAFKDDLDRLHAKYPWLTVNFVPGKDDAAFAKAVAAGNPPDVFISTAPDYVGQFCHNGTVLDMNPYLQSAKIDVAKTFPAPALVYTQFQGKQCALPLLTDAYGLFYNKAMFQAAGISGPPKTFSELLADTKKLTVRNPNGSIKTYGFVMRSDYNNNVNLFQGVQTNSKYYDSNTKATFGTDANWKSVLQLDQSVTDYLGANNVQQFVARYQAHSDDAANPFITGAAAMEYDGEWHIGEIKDAKPNMDYGVAPFPVADNQASRYGVGNTQGTIVYIPSRTKHPQEAFFAVQQLTTDTQFLTTLADAVSNIPSTFDSLSSWDQASDPRWQTLISIFKNPGSYYKELTPAGAEDAQAWGQFLQKFERGHVGNLDSGLQAVAKQIDSINAQAQ